MSRQVSYFTYFDDIFVNTRKKRVFLKQMNVTKYVSTYVTTYSCQCLFGRVEKERENTMLILHNNHFDCISITILICIYRNYLVIDTCKLIENCIFSSSFFVFFLTVSYVSQVFYFWFTLFEYMLHRNWWLWLNHVDMI